TSGCVKAKIYVIAANGIETPRLLLMSKNGGRTANGVANSSDMVGRNLMDHPYYVAWGLTPKPVYPYRGPLITSGIGDLCDGPFRAKRSAFRIDIGNEGWNFVVGGDPNVTTSISSTAWTRPSLTDRPERPCLAKSSSKS